MPNTNFFDDLMSSIDPKEALAAAQESDKKAQRLDYLIHKVFHQSDEGVELIEIWKQTLIMTPTASPGDDNISIGIAEGYKRFIRGILLTIKRVNDGR